MPIFVGTMRAAETGVWADDDAQRRLARAIFGTPLDRRVYFSEPHGFWIGLLWPGLLHVWMEDGR